MPTLEIPHSMTIGCLLCLIIQSSRCVLRYLERDSRVIQNLKSARDVTFIAFTVCPSFADAYNETMLKKHGTNKTIYKAGKDLQQNEIGKPFPEI